MIRDIHREVEAWLETNPEKISYLVHREKVPLELLWSSLVNSGIIRMFWKDTDRRFIGATDSFLRYYGFMSEKDIAGKNDEDEEFIKNCPVPLIEVWNKCDAASQNPVAPDALCVSAKNGIGLPALFNQIEAILKNGISTERTQAGLGSARQKAAVSEALESARHALLTSEDNYTLDAVVQDLEDALDFLGEVTGAITPDDVLGSIFANFCVGK